MKRYQLILLPLGLLLLWDFTAQIAVEMLWFQELGYLSVFLLRIKTQLGLWAIALLLSITFFGINFALASRNLKSNKAILNQHSELRLRWLLPIVIGLSLLTGLILLHYHSVEIAEFAPLQWQIVALLILAVATILYPQLWLKTIALLLSLSFSFLLAKHWATILQSFHPTPFHSIDPLFGRDISFYIFSLPVWEVLKSWLLGLSASALIAITLIYLLSGNSLSEGKFLGFTSPQLRHLSLLGAITSIAIALHYWVKRYQLLYSHRGITYGASYTDVTIQLPIYTIITFVALSIALILIWQTLFPSTLQLPWRFWGTLILLTTCATTLLPATIQKFIVQPNELATERPYIQRSIALTRQAFNLNQIEAQTFAPQGQLTATDLQQNDLTIRNIRLWDTRPLLKTNRQLQQIRPYYKFPNADIDRYTLKEDAETEKQQTIIAARELDYAAVPPQAKTWVNEHLVYTHGYGFTLSPVNKVGAGGLPDYYVKDIGIDATGNEGSLQISNPQIRASIPTGQPRIYYGEISNTYVMTGTKVKELDYPSGNQNAYNVYDGRGGIALGNLWRRCLFAEYLKDWQMLLTQNFTSQTKLLFRRQISARVQAIAPFLRFDRDPYLVVADAGGTNNRGEKTYLNWIIDAYTTSDRYPYADPGKHKFNYIRNSVKVVVDAYSGAVNFYIDDPQDPIINTFAQIFPNLFKPLTALPENLRSHLRYPGDLFGIQSERLLVYHMTDPQVFYNREDQWQVPNEIYGTQPQTVEPYYLILKLPTAKAEEFILLLPFVPKQRNNLIAWLAARSDGENYGKLLLYQFPKQQLIYGTEQIEALINQDPVISQQISLWNRSGSRALQGNLLVIPIERSLLYVEPIYLEAEQNSLPTLARVIVVYQNRIVMAETLQQALKAIFQPTQPASPAIVRPVQ